MSTSPKRSYIIRDRCLYGFLTLAIHADGAQKPFPVEYFIADRMLNERNSPGQSQLNDSQKFSDSMKCPFLNYQESKPLKYLILDLRIYVSLHFLKLAQNYAIMLINVFFVLENLHHWIFFCWNQRLLLWDILLWFHKLNWNFFYNSVDDFMGSLIISLKS